MLHLQQFLYITRVFGWFLSYMNKKQEQTEEHEGTIYSQSLCYTCISLKFFIFNTHDDKVFLIIVHLIHLLVSVVDYKFIRFWKKAF